MKISTLKHKNFFEECTHLAADAIYATNENHKYTTQKDIQMNKFGSILAYANAVLIAKRRQKLANQAKIAA